MNSYGKAPLVARQKAKHATPSYYIQRNHHSRNHLLSLTWAQRWDDVQQRIRTHPEEARHINQSLRSPLHLCMFGFDSVPASVVVTLLGANQFAVVHRDLIGWTPIHYACQFGVSAEILTLLLCVAVSVSSVHRPMTTNEEKNPQVTTTSPLFMSCNRNADTRVLSVLLDYSLSYPDEIGWWVAPLTGAERYDDGDNWEPELLTRLNNLFADYSSTVAKNSANGDMADFNSDDCLDMDGQTQQVEVSNLTPLQVLWSHFPSNRTWRREDQSTEIIANDSKEDFTHFWEKVIMILSFHDLRWRSSIQKNDHVETKSPRYGIDKASSFMSDRKELLHHACALRRPIPEFVRFSLKLYSHQTLEFDTTGNLPLHHSIVALSQQSSNNPQASPNEYDSKRVQIFRDVLEANTVAASLPNDKKRLPLFLAIEAPCITWEDGLGALVSAAPFVLQTMDVATQMYPFMLAAAVAKKSSGIEKVFKLLKSCPEASSHGLIEE